MITKSNLEEVLETLGFKKSGNVMHKNIGLLIVN